MNCAYCRLNDSSNQENPFSQNSEEVELSMAECCFALICETCISKHFEYCLQCGEAVSGTTLIKLPHEISQAI